MNNFFTKISNSLIKKNKLSYLKSLFVEDKNIQEFYAFVLDHQENVLMQAHDSFPLKTNSELLFNYAIETDNLSLLKNIFLHHVEPSNTQLITVALHRVVMTASFETALYLFEYAIKNRDETRTKFLASSCLAFSAPHSTSISFMDYLFNKGADLYELDCMAFKKSCHHYNYEGIKFFIDHGLNVQDAGTISYSIKEWINNYINSIELSKKLKHELSPSTYSKKALKI